MQKYIKTSEKLAKLFELGDEDGTLETKDINGNTVVLPYILGRKQERFLAEYGNYYLCINDRGERFLVEKGIFESKHTLNEPEL